MGYWYDVYVNDDQEPWNRDVYLTKEQACGLANSLYDKGWSVCVTKMVEDAEGFVKEVWRSYWSFREKMK
ncbi:MAG: hypothetical protein IKE76_12575 [Clostridia bacterium]|nr:hypothetical protein [Clostridia bacterium]